MGTADGLDVRTSSLSRRLPTADDVGGPGNYAIAVVRPAEPLLDAIAFSRGHFTVDAPGQPRLVLPAHPEVARVVEDCRT